MTDSSEDSTSTHTRRIRSFVLRQGRLTTGQARAMSELMPLFGVKASNQFLDWRSVFGNDHPVVLEIGIGNGDALAHCAQADPQRNYLGAEVHAPGVGHGLLAIEKLALTNAKIYHGDAVELLLQNVPDGSLAKIHIWFPDPWHKARHNKRRLIQPEFVSLLRSKLSTNGQLHLATDWQAYAEHMMQVMSADPGFVNCAGAEQFIEKPSWRPNTHFERRGERLGHGVWDLLFEKR